MERKPPVGGKKLPVKKERPPVVYISEGSTEYVVSPKGNLHAGEKTGRMNYLSRELGQRLLDAAKGKTPIGMTEDEVFSMPPYDRPGGHMLYECLVRGETTFSSQIQKRVPPFLKNSDGKSIDDKT
jgi:hypothetical protein